MLAEVASEACSFGRATCASSLAELVRVLALMLHRRWLVALTPRKDLKICVEHTRDAHGRRFLEVLQRPVLLTLLALARGSIRLGRGSLIQLESSTSPAAAPVTSKIHNVVGSAQSGIQMLNGKRAHNTQCICTGIKIIYANKHACRIARVTWGNTNLLDCISVGKLV